MNTLDKCIVLPVKDAIDEKESIKINHGFEVIHSCNLKLYITGVSGVYQKRITTKCEDLGNCKNIVYEANYFIPNPITNWKMKKTFNLDLPNGSVITYVGEKTFCENIIGGKYLGTRIIKRKVVISNEEMETQISDGVLVSKEDVNLDLFEAKKYVIEKIELSNSVIFDGNGESIDYFNNIKTTEETKIAYDENPNLTDFRGIVKEIIGKLLP